MSGIYQEMWIIKIQSLFVFLLKWVLKKLWFVQTLFVKLFSAPPPRQEPCSPSPCGPNAQCRVVNGQAVCSCLPNYVGSPPSCRPECVVSSECPLVQACINNKCLDPCPNTCGIGAQCTVRNHNPICACPIGQTGDPFVRCYPIRKSHFYLIYLFFLFFLKKN